jgi:hypothetical protein
MFYHYFYYCFIIINYKSYLINKYNYKSYINVLLMFYHYLYYY